MRRKTAGFAGIVAVAAWTLALAGCVDAPNVQTLAVQPSVAQLQAIRGVQADYVYYPDYGIYFSPNYHQYVFRYNSAWMTQSYPPSLYADVLPTARSVPMNFHDDPRWHDAEVIRAFPGNRPPGVKDVASRL